MKFNFNHDESGIAGALGISSEDMERIAKLVGGLLSGIEKGDTASKRIESAYAVFKELGPEEVSVIFVFYHHLMSTKMDAVMDGAIMALGGGMRYVSGLMDKIEKEPTKKKEKGSKCDN
jgi:hypothetical protein